MKRIIVIVVLICVFCVQFPISTYASEKEFKKIYIASSTDKIGQWYDIIKIDDNIMFSGEDLEILTGYTYVQKGDTASFSRGKKTIKVNIKKNTYTVLENLSDFSFVNKVENINGIMYYSGAEILPWLNVTCLEEDGKLYIIKDFISFWEICDEFEDEIEKISFDFEKCCQELGVNSKWLQISSYVKNEGISGLLSDMIWIPGSNYALGTYVEYMTMFEEMLHDGARIECAYQELKKDSDKINAAFEFIDSIEMTDELPDELQVIKIANSIFSAYDDVVDFITYTYVLESNNKECLKWVESMADNRHSYDYPDAMVSAGMETGYIYQKNFDSYFSRILHLLSDDIIDGVIGELTGEGALNVLLSAFGLVVSMNDSWTDKISDIPNFSTLAKCGMDVYIQNKMSSHIKGIELQRAHLMFYLYGTEQNWRIMEDYARDHGCTDIAVKYCEIANQCLSWQGKFMLTANSTVNDSHEYGSGYAKKEYEESLKADFNRLKYLEEEEFTLESVKEIISEAIYRYTLFRNEGMCCDYNYEDYLSEEEIRKFIGEDEVSCLEYYRVTCCKTPLEAKKHLLCYIKESLLEEDIDNCFEQVQGMLYFVTGPKGWINYGKEEYRIIEFNRNRIQVVVDIYSSGGTKIGECTFFFENNGYNFVIVKVVEKNL